MVNGQLRVNLNQVYEHAQLLFSVPSLEVNGDKYDTDIVCRTHSGTQRNLGYSGQVEHQRWGNCTSALGPPTGGCVPRAFFFNLRCVNAGSQWLEVQELRSLASDAITGGAGTAFPCIRWHIIYTDIVQHSLGGVVACQSRARHQYPIGRDHGESIRLPQS